MNTSKKGHRKQQIASRRTCEVASAAGSAIFLAASGSTAYAQATPPEALEEVVVTGIRAGIDNAIELKRDSSSIVEAISAEDIGKLAGHQHRRIDFAPAWPHLAACRRPRVRNQSCAAPIPVSRPRC